MPKDLSVSLLLDIYGPVLTQKQREAAELYYNEDLSLGEIAENCGISRQGVRDSIKRGEGILFELEEKLGFLRKSGAVRDAAEDIRQSVDGIKFLAGRRAFSEEITEFADSIAARLEELEKYGV